MIAEWLNNFATNTVPYLFSYVAPLFTNWTPANWIAFGTGAASFGLGIRNSRKAAKGERQKNKREEFHRRVATPIELALSQFGSINDDLYDLRDGSSLADATAIDAIEKRSKRAQRKLSKELRWAANSNLCGIVGWDIGAAEYDELIEHLDGMRNAQTFAEQAQEIDGALSALDRHDRLIREKIRSELAEYT
ncbi:MAG TPA: hypothetical protein VFA53_00070 [Xanthobacteraceae bacterium]|nr:hypothetical protein [Xanthobacteraceae bacterium]